MHVIEILCILHSVDASVAVAFGFGGLPRLRGGSAYAGGMEFTGGVRVTAGLSEGFTGMAFACMRTWESFLFRFLDDIWRVAFPGPVYPLSAVAEHRSEILGRGGAVVARAKVQCVNRG